MDPIRFDTPGTPAQAHGRGAWAGHGARPVGKHYHVVSVRTSPAAVDHPPKLALAHFHPIVPDSGSDASLSSRDSRSSSPVISRGARASETTASDSSLEPVRPRPETPVFFLDEPKAGYRKVRYVPPSQESRISAAERASRVEDSEDEGSRPDESGARFDLSELHRQFDEAEDPREIALPEEETPARDVKHLPAAEQTVTARKPGVDERLTQREVDPPVAARRLEPLRPSARFEKVTRATSQLLAHVEVMDRLPPRRASVSEVARRFIDTALPGGRTWRFGSRTPVTALEVGNVLLALAEQPGLVARADRLVNALLAELMKRLDLKDRSNADRDAFLAELVELVRLPDARGSMTVSKVVIRAFEELRRALGGAKMAPQHAEAIARAVGQVWGAWSGRAAEAYHAFVEVQVTDLVTARPTRLQRIASWFRRETAPLRVNPAVANALLRGAREQGPEAMEQATQAVMTGMAKAVVRQVQRASLPRAQQDELVQVHVRSRAFELLESMMFVGSSREEGAAPRRGVARAALTLSALPRYARAAPSLTGSLVDMAAAEVRQLPNMPLAAYSEQRQGLFDGLIQERRVDERLIKTVDLQGLECMERQERIRARAFRLVVDGHLPKGPVGEDAWCSDVAKHVWSMRCPADADPELLIDLASELAFNAKGMPPHRFAALAEGLVRGARRKVPGADRMARMYGDDRWRRAVEILLRDLADGADAETKTKIAAFIGLGVARALAPRSDPIGESPVRFETKMH